MRDVGTACGGSRATAMARYHCRSRLGGTVGPSNGTVTAATTAGKGAGAPSNGVRARARVVPGTATVMRTRVFALLRQWNGRTNV
jgi:hypothetical protein